MNQDGGIAMSKLSMSLPTVLITSVGYLSFNTGPETNPYRYQEPLKQVVTTISVPADIVVQRLPPIPTERKVERKVVPTPETHTDIIRPRSRGGITLRMVEYPETPKPSFVQQMPDKHIIQTPTAHYTPCQAHMQTDKDPYLGNHPDEIFDALPELVDLDEEYDGLAELVEPTKRKNKEVSVKKKKRRINVTISSGGVTIKLSIPPHIFICDEMRDHDYHVFTSDQWPVYESEYRALPTCAVGGTRDHLREEVNEIVSPSVIGIASIYMTYRVVRNICRDAYEWWSSGTSSRATTPGAHIEEII